MKRDIINYSLLAVIGIILILSFVFNYRDFDYYLQKVIAAETEEAKKENFKKAMNSWSESTGNTKKAAAYLYMGLYYFTLERYEESIKELDQGIKIDPELMELYQLRGTGYRRLQILDKSLSDFNLVLDKNPVNPHALLDRGLTYHKMKDYDKALKDFDISLELAEHQDKNKVLRAMGILFIENGDSKSALSTLRRSFQLNKEPFTILLSIIAASGVSDDEYKNEKKRLDEVVPGNDWERSLIKFYLGDITEETLFAEARKAINEKKVRERLCEAYYYAGKEIEYNGDKKKAQKYYRLSLKQNIPEFIEYGLAESELQEKEKE